SPPASAAGGPRLRCAPCSYPCLCLCFWLLQMMRTTPCRRTTLHLTQILRTDDRTFTRSPARKLLILPWKEPGSEAPPHDAAPSGVVGEELDHHRLAGEDAAQAGRPRDVGHDQGPAFGLELHAVEGVGQRLQHRARDLDRRG